LLETFGFHCWTTCVTCTGCILLLILTVPLRFWTGSEVTRFEHYNLTKSVVAVLYFKWNSQWSDADDIFSVSARIVFICIFVYIDVFHCVYEKCILWSINQPTVILLFTKTSVCRTFFVSQLLVA